MKEIILKGQPLSKGLATGRVCLFNENRHENLPMFKVQGKGLERQHARVTRAIELVGKHLDELQRDTETRIGPAEAQIFAVQNSILHDEQLQGAIFKHMEEQEINAESAVSYVIGSYEKKLKALDNDYIQERASDIVEIKHRLLDALRNMQLSLQCNSEKCQKGRHRIIVTEELTPRMTVDIDPQETMGFVTEHGGINSHAAIMARALDIPAVGGIAGILERVGCGTELFINGTTGEVIIWPDAKRIEAFRKTRAEAHQKLQPRDPVQGFSVLANINLAHEASESIAMRSEGIGLYRTEFQLLAEERFLSEEELFHAYKEVGTIMADKPITFRLYDIGSDKQLPFMEIPGEDNPALGWRGSRLLLARKDLLRDQARALARVSKTRPVNVMYPMIVDIDQFLDLKEVFMEAADDLAPGTINHGIMFEVPSACFAPDVFFEHIDFGSIGTNDLTQYFFAVDRDNDRVSYDYNPDRPAFWAVIGRIADAAKGAGKPLSICGELAGNPQYTAKLIELGIDTVSVTPKRIPAVRQAAADALARAGVGG